MGKREFIFLGKINSNVGELPSGMEGSFLFLCNRLKYSDMIDRNLWHKI